MKAAGRWRVCLSLALASAGGVAGRVSAAPQDIVILAPDAVIERHADASRVHLYQVALAAGECVRLRVEQRGADAVVQVVDPDDTANKTVTAEFQDEVGYRGEEQIDLVSTQAVTYILAVRLTLPTGADRAAAGYVIRMAGRHAATDAERVMWEVRTLRAAAARHTDQNHPALARPLLERAEQLAEQVRGPDSPYVGLLWFDLAASAGAMRDSTAAVTCYQRALTILDKALGPNHPSPAWVRSRFAALRVQAGQYREAELLLQPALTALDQALGPEHLWYVRTLITFAALRIELADYDTAGEVDRRILAILERTQRTEMPLYGGTLNNLGEVYRRTRKYAEAESCYLRALSLFERLGGPDSRDVALELQNLGIIAEQSKDYAKAISYDLRALAIKERTVGRDHPEVGQILNNLALVYHVTGDDPKALATYARALAIFEKASPSHHNTMTTIASIARVYAATGDVTNALAWQHRVDDIIERQLEMHLTIGSERQKLDFAGSIAERTDRTLSLHLTQAPDNSDAASLAALVVLQRKGRVLDAMTDTLGIVRQRIAETGDRTLLDRVDQLKAATAELARVALNSGGILGVAEREQRLEELRKRREELEGDLQLHSATFRAQLRPVTLDGVQAAIPEDAALIEFAVFHPFDPRNNAQDDAYGPPHYAAYVLHKGSTPRGFDLGPAQPIDEAIAAWRETLRDPARRGHCGRARKVDELIMHPLRPAIGNAARLLISPDGALNLAPFDALVDEHSHYLIERYAVSYLTSGRDLLRMQEDTHTSRQAPVILADPLFGEPGMVRIQTVSRTRLQAPAQAQAQTPTPPAAAGTRARSVTVGEAMSPMYFAPLMASAAEARAIKGLFPESTLLLGRQATKEALQRLDAPRVLHIASHGFFLHERTVMNVENPLLQSGIALAGANVNREPDDTHDDGILTALEASGLNLWGTRLVTLSGCDTGVGEVRNGEGVYGLRRAFVLAGAETLVMSLWPVSDSVARETMTAYYTGLRAGLGRGEALRQAKLAMLKRQARRHPFYWASFIQSGEWANLEGVR